MCGRARERCGRDDRKRTSADVRLVPCETCALKMNELTSDVPLA